MEKQPGNLLVVEDNLDILNLLNTTLSFKGYRVVTARNGNEALEAIKRERPVIIITDILMPQMDGFSLVHRLRLNPDTRDIPVVFLSATYVTPEDKSFALNLGVIQFIEKPVNFDDFLPALEKLVSMEARATQAPLDEAKFYTEYRKRLETKLIQKNTQIARSERLMQTLPEAERPAFLISMHQSMNERMEIQHLLDEIHALMDDQMKSE
jgi:DNA-binding response OmpR family regulator